MIPGSTQQLFHVPYSGNIEAINAQRAVSLEVSETQDVSRIFEAQIKRVADAGLYNMAAKPAVAGGLIVLCPANDVQKIYDAVYGTSEAAPSATILAFPKAAAKTPSTLNAAFETSAAKFRLNIDFPMAARAPVGDNSNNLVLQRELAA